MTSPPSPHAGRRWSLVRKAVAWVLVIGCVAVGVFLVACHKNARVQSDAHVVPVTKDTARVVPPPPITDTSVLALFKDTVVVSVFSAEGHTFKLPGERQSLRAALRKERELWQARKPREYKFLLRVGCFCPGTRGWLLMEVRAGQPLRAWDKAGNSAALTDWNTFSIDGLYDSLDRTANINGQVQIAFDPRWHFPKYVHSVVLPGPDAWSTTEVRGFRPI